MNSRLNDGAVGGAWVTAGPLLAVAVSISVALAATMHATGASLGETCWVVVPGLGWGGLTFACGWWAGARNRERVAIEVAAVLAPVIKELKHLRCALAQPASVDELAKTGVHPRRVAPATDDALTVVASLDQVREVVR